MNRTGIACAVGVTLVLGACRQERDEEAGAVGDTARRDTTVETRATGQGMADQMHSHMVVMEGASPDSAKAMLSMHRQMTANMLSEFTRQMREMNMTGDAAWTATADSIRADLTRMPDLSAPELKAMMPAHHARIMRLMEMHDAMMKNMKM